MISQSFALLVSLMILGAEAFALFLIILGAIDLHTHITEKRERVSK